MGTSLFLIFAFEAALRAVFPDAFSWRDLSIHRDIDSGGQYLQSADCTTEIEERVARAKFRRYHRTREHDDLVGDPAQRGGGFRHRVGSVGDQDQFFARRQNPFTNQRAVFRRHGETILLEHRFDFVSKGYVRLFEQRSDLGFADIVAARSIEIDFVDRAAGGDDADLHGLVRNRNPNPRAGNRSLDRAKSPKRSKAGQIFTAMLAGWTDFPVLKIRHLNKCRFFRNLYSGKILARPKQKRSRYE